MATGAASRLLPGDVESFSPDSGDIHQGSDGAHAEISVSIHVYGGNIGAISRRSFKPDGSTSEFVSGYSNKHDTADRHQRKIDK